MDIFKLPTSTLLGRVIPKNVFDEKTNTNQKRLISNHIARIKWVHKLDTKTTNLKANSINEIQIFHVELKQKNSVNKVLAILDKVIPYHIIFIASYDEDILLYTSAKHDHITKAHESVIDCTFSTEWIPQNDCLIKINLEKSLDFTFVNFCQQITKRQQKYESYHTFVDTEIQIKSIEHKIKLLNSQIKKEKQFNKKVELNLQKEALIAKLNQN